MNHTQSSTWSRLSVFLFILAMVLVQTSSADIQTSYDNLPADKLKQVRQTGNALLRSRAMVERQNPEAEQIRTQVKQIHASLTSIIGSVVTPSTMDTSGLRVEGNGDLNASLAVNRINAPSTANAVSQNNAAQALQDQLQTLGQYCADYRQKTTPPTQSFLEKALSFFSVDSSAKEKPVMTTVTETVLDRLERLPDEINTAMALPKVERTQALSQIQKGLQFYSSGMLREPDSESIIQTPTLSARTKHR
jgi:hypothetical protein